MVIGPNNFGVDRDMVGHQGIGDDTFVKPEVLGRIAGIDRRNAGFKPLAITARVEYTIDVILSEDRQRCSGIADEIVLRQAMIMRSSTSCFA